METRVSEMQARNSFVVYDTAEDIVFVREVESITREGTTATATMSNHGFTDGKVLAVSGADQEAYNGEITVTEVTRDTFSYEVAGNPATPATGSPLVTDVDSSPVVSFPRILQTDTVPEETSVQVQQRIHAGAEWVNVGEAIDNAAGPSMVIFDVLMNFVRVVRTGVEDVKIYVQSN